MGRYYISQKVNPGSVANPATFWTLFFSQNMRQAHPYCWLFYQGSKIWQFLLFFIAMGTNSLHKIPSFFKFGAVETAPIIGIGFEARTILHRVWKFATLGLQTGSKYMVTSHFCYRERRNLVIFCSDIVVVVILQHWPPTTDTPPQKRKKEREGFAIC